MSVSGISHAHPRCVGTLHLYHVLKGVKVALGLRHLFIVNHDIAIAEVRTRHIFVRTPNTDVVLHCHGQMIADQIFARTPQVYRLVLFKFFFDFVECIHVCFTFFV